MLMTAVIPGTGQPLTARRWRSSALEMAAKSGALIRQKQHTAMRLAAGSEGGAVPRRGSLVQEGQANVGDLVVEEIMRRFACTQQAASRVDEVVKQEMMMRQAQRQTHRRCRREGS